MELKLKLVTTSPGGWWWWVGGGGWTKKKLMLFSTQVEVIVDLKLELSLAKHVEYDNARGEVRRRGWMKSL